MTELGQSDLGRRPDQGRSADVFSAMGSRTDKRLTSGSVTNSGYRSGMVDISVECQVSHARGGVPVLADRSGFSESALGLPLGVHRVEGLIEQLLGAVGALVREGARRQTAFIAGQPDCVGICLADG